MDRYSDDLNENENENDFKENQSSNLKHLIALYDREPTDGQEIAIRKNDRLILIEEINDKMLKVRNIRSQKSGLINRHMVKSFSNLFASQE